MNRIIDRITAMGINPESASFTITTSQLIKAISEEADIETITDHELREIVFIVCKALNRMDWKSVVTHAVNHLPFGLYQTGIAWEGHKPCSGCPDAMLFDNNCYHHGECKSWEIYEARL
jgi:hypothetical protein